TRTVIPCRLTCGMHGDWGRAQEPRRGATSRHRRHTATHKQVHLQTNQRRSIMSKKLITDPADLQAELEKLKAENAELQQNKGGIFVGDAPLEGGMREPSNKIVKVIPQASYKGEKL